LDLREYSHKGNLEELMIRKIKKEEVYRIGEILAYANRLNYYPIFNDISFSFGVVNVKDIGDNYLKDEHFLNNTYVYVDEVIKGFIYLKNKEVDKLYVDSFFTSKGIGSELLKFAIDKFDVDKIWALEKNTRAIKFYQRHGFKLSKERKLEEGTSEYLVLLQRCTK